MCHCTSAAAAADDDYDDDDDNDDDDDDDSCMRVTPLRPQMLRMPYFGEEGYWRQIFHLLLLQKELKVGGGRERHT